MAKLSILGWNSPWIEQEFSSQLFLSGQPYTYHIPGSWPTIQSINGWKVFLCRCNAISVHCIGNTLLFYILVFRSVASSERWMSSKVISISLAECHVRPHICQAQAHPRHTPRGWACWARRDRVRAQSGNFQWLESGDRVATIKGLIRWLF
jgi:hypothetical protein